MARALAMPTSVQVARDHELRQIETVPEIRLSHERFPSSRHAIPFSVEEEYIRNRRKERREAKTLMAPEWMSMHMALRDL
jgi:hypothetical protein